MVLDHIEGIIIEETDNRLPTIDPLGYLPLGIHMCADNIRRMEMMYSCRNIGKYQLNPSMPAFLPTANNFFIWFSNSLYNFVRTVGMVQKLNQEDWNLTDLTDKEKAQLVKQHIKKYLEKVIPDILIWRNKVGAHVAASYPIGNDNIMTLELSMMAPVSYVKPYLTAFGFKIVDSSGAESNIPSWNLSEEWEKLKPRYWPDKTIPSFCELAIKGHSLKKCESNCW